YHTWSRGPGDPDEDKKAKRQSIHEDRIRKYRNLTDKFLNGS
ncbi:unnamed protein product, partial [Allacma fusca]